LEKVRGFRNFSMWAKKKITRDDHMVCGRIEWDFEGFTGRLELS
jgi:hypothetical protein